MSKIKSNKFVIIIPARYSSSRLPGKPLRLINNKPLIYLTWKNITKSVENKNVYVATDSDKIRKVCDQYGMKTIMTSSTCRTGSDRVSEASNKFKDKLIINLQGDEPFLKKRMIKKFIKFALKNKNHVTNCFTKIKKKSEFFSVNIPKVLVDKNNDLLYMSRSHVPGSKKKNFNNSFKQVCIYGFPIKILKKYFGVDKKKSLLEKTEDIEILRFIENQVIVKMLEVEDNLLSVDTNSDLKKANQISMRSL